VIAVPAKFDSQQRAATGAAYAAAGLKVMRVIEEPTAAAVAYKLHKKANIHHILVYDFGGGTLDVSLLYVAKGSVQVRCSLLPSFPLIFICLFVLPRFKVYATDGDETLGGSDFDLCLAKHIRGKVR
jgi:molecular chaperone DnaK (HSP70)